MSSAEIWGLSARAQWESAIDQAIGATAAEDEKDINTAAERSYLLDLGFTSDAEVKAWMAREKISEIDLSTRARRHERWLRFCSERWGHLLANRYLKRKEDLDRVEWASLCLDSYDLLFELFIRVKENEVGIVDVVNQIPDSQRLHLTGSFGPVPISAAPLKIRDKLKSHQQGSIIPPFQIDSNWIFCQIMSKTSSVLDDQTRRRLLLELGDEHLLSSLH